MVTLYILSHSKVKPSIPDWGFVTESSGEVAALALAAECPVASSHLGGGGNTGLEAAGSDPETTVILLVNLWQTSASRGKSCIFNKAMKC